MKLSISLFKLSIYSVIIYSFSSLLLYACTSEPTAPIVSIDSTIVEENPRLVKSVPATTDPSKPDPNSYEVNVEGYKVPVYTYQDFKAFLERTDDKIYVVNFWATWCKPCVEELPYFEQLYQQYKDQNVHLLLVSLDFEKQIEKKLIPFMDKHQLQGEVIVLQQKGMNNWIDKIEPTWSGALPATIIYHKDKRVFHEQSFTYKELEATLKPFVES